jgi:hypothetical protein
MAAKTIDPAIGASTWALGNHKWTENIGSLTRNPAKAISQKIELFINKFGKKSSVCIDIILWAEYKYTLQKVKNIGKEAVIVYNIKYILACIRSG